MAGSNDAVASLAVGWLVLQVRPALLCGLSVLRTGRSRLWLLAFVCLPILGPLLYWLWPSSPPSQPSRR